VNYWLTQQDNELVAAAEAQPTLFALNGLAPFSWRGLVLGQCS
jgi:hypothetical protein